MVDRLAKIGIVPGKDFDIATVDAAVARGLAKVPAVAQQQIMAHFKDGGTLANGWMFSTRAGV